LTKILNRTPLYPIYEKYNAKTFNFAGWELPVQFSGITREHTAVRQSAGLFDVSHMGEVMVKGEDAEKTLQYILTNDISKMQLNQVLYTAMCYPDGGTVDDLLVYKLNSDEYLLVVNAANIHKDVEWIKKNAIGKVTIEDISDKIAQLAIQGPKAENILQKLTTTHLGEIRPFRFIRNCIVDGINALISRTGYTGEDGFELYLESAFAIHLWEKLLAAGRDEGIEPCGLGARDTLRFEARLLLYGQDLSEKISPLEAGIGFVVKMNKPSDFIGKKALKEQKENGLQRQLVGLEIIDKGIARHGYDVYADHEKKKWIGYVTSGIHSPTLKKSLALALISTEYTSLDTILYVDIRGKQGQAKVTKLPFYKRH
jgi:aminomethyltransferase